MKKSPRLRALVSLAEIDWGPSNRTYRNVGLDLSRCLPNQPGVKRDRAAFIRKRAAPGPAVTSAVPEPSTWAMVIVGFAGIGFMGYCPNSHE
jgi:hypothetical protein